MTFPLYESSADKDQSSSPKPSDTLPDIIPTYEQPPWADEVNRPDSTPSEPSNATLRERATLALRAAAIVLNSEQHAPNETQKIELTERQRRELENDRERIIYEAHGILRAQRDIVDKSTLPWSYYGSTVLSATGEDEKGVYELAYYTLYHGHEIILTSAPRPGSEAERQKLLIFKTGYKTESVVNGVVPLNSVTPEEARQIVNLLRKTTFTNPRIDALPTLF